MRPSNASFVASFILLLLVVRAGIAWAETPTPTLVTGRVTDVLGRPIANARVHVLPRASAPHETTTDKDGRYRVEVTTEGTHAVVIAIGKVHTFRSVIVARGTTTELDVDAELDIEGGEVITIEDKKRPLPAQKPKSLRDPNVALPYSDEAMERDAWARAWLLLDVDATGSVTRLKLLKRPGFDLDKIAIEEAFALKFEPARDAQGRPTSTYVVWSMEWPSWGWLIQGHGTAMRKPNDHDELHKHGQNFRSHGLARANWARPLASATAFPHALSRVPCAGSGPINLDMQNRAYRDCSRPDLRGAEALPWITRETAARAITELATTRLDVVQVATTRSRTPEIITLSLTGVFAIATVVSFTKYQRYAKQQELYNWQASIDPVEYAKHVDRRERWAKASLAMGSALVISTGVSLFLWNRKQPASAFSVQPTGDGAAASFTRSF